MKAGQFVYTWHWFDGAESKSGAKINGVNGKYRYMLLIEEKLGGFVAAYTTTQSLGSPLSHEVVVDEKMSQKMGQKKSFKIDFKYRDFVSIDDVKSCHGSIAEDAGLLRRCAKAAAAAGIM